MFFFSLKLCLVFFNDLQNDFLLDLFKVLNFSNLGGIIHVSEGSFATYGVNQDNHKEHLIEVSKIFWSYPKQLIQESSKADIVFSY